jgi:DNA replication protein DnaC
LKNKEAKIGEACKKCNLFHLVYHRYFQANIPIKYWFLEMEKDFSGFPGLKKEYQEYVSDLKNSYHTGKSILFSGFFGSGKTFAATNILKRAAEKNYSCLYVTLNDIVYSVINNTAEDKSASRQELLLVDFLVIDEFDPRHMGSEQGAELFGRIFEDVFRSRIQNNLPTILCTNASKIEEAFKEGPIRNSISSLLNYVKRVVVVSEDFRKKGK